MIKFIKFENKNLIAFSNPHDFEIEIIFKKNCNPKVKEMWEKLNRPIDYDTKILRKSR